MEQPLHFHDRFGHSVAGVLATPDRPTPFLAVLCHGFLSHKDSTTNQTLTRLLRDRGIATLRFDFFGHGESDGPFEHITTTIGVAQATAALREGITRGFDRLGLVGSSFGGLVSILAAAGWPPAESAHTASDQDGAALACLALKCPVVDFAEELRLEFGDAGMTQWKTTDTIPNIRGGRTPIPLRYAFYEDCAACVAYEPARRIRVPTLIVQGDCDEMVPLHQSRRLADSLAGPVRLELLSGADHQFTNPEDFARMTTLIVEWLSGQFLAGNSVEGPSDQV